jgi:hypothetical protein
MEIRTSESINEIATALVQVQAKLQAVKKDAKGNRSKYATINNVLEEVRPKLNESGIALLQSPCPSNEGTVAVATRLLHTSGQWIEGTAITEVSSNAQIGGAQAYGSAITYLRRYSLVALLGIETEDDDGASASQPKQASKPMPQTNPKIEPAIQSDEKPISIKRDIEDITKDWSLAKKQAFGADSRSLAGLMNAGNVNSLVDVRTAVKEAV